MPGVQPDERTRRFRKEADMNADLGPRLLSTVLLSIRPARGYWPNTPTRCQNVAGSGEARSLCSQSRTKHHGTCKEWCETCTEDLVGKPRLCFLMSEGWTNKEYKTISRYLPDVGAF